MKVKCQKCGYEWDTSSSMSMVTCPSCGYKTPRNAKAGDGGNSKSSISQKEVKNLSSSFPTKWTGAIALVAIVAVGALVASVYMGGEQSTPSAPSEEQPEPGTATVTAQVGDSGVSFAASEPSKSGIENIYILDNATDHTLTNDLSGHSDLLGTITSDGDSVDIPYEQGFDIVVAVKGHDDNLAYVAKENINVEYKMTGDITKTLDNIDNTNKNVFDSTSTYARVNATNANLQDLELLADQSASITVNLWLYG